MARQNLAEWLHNRFGLTLKQTAEQLKEVLPGLGATITEDELALTDVATANASSSAHGFLKKLSSVASEVLDGQGSWRSIATILGYTPMDAAAGAGGVLSGNYPNPGFAVNMATQDEVDAAVALKAPLSPTVNAQTETTYTLVAGDNGKIVTLDNGSAITVTVPAGLGAGFNCVCIQKGAGQVTFVADTATLTNRQSQLKIAGQWGVVGILAPVANALVLSGDTAA